MCKVEDHVWMGDTMSKIHVLRYYVFINISFHSCTRKKLNTLSDGLNQTQKFCVNRINDYSKTVESDLESHVGYVGAIVSIKYIDLNVAVAFSSGRLFLCDKTTAQPLTELGNASVIHCLSSRFVGEGLVAYLNDLLCFLFLLFCEVH